MRGHDELEMVPDTVTDDDSSSDVEQVVFYFV